MSDSTMLQMIFWINCIEFVVLVLVLSWIGMYVCDLVRVAKSELEIARKNAVENEVD